jgi:hemerythrin
MPVMEWDDSFELGINDFDKHHKRLIDLLNIAFDGFICRAGHDEIKGVLIELSDYATYHFAVEEHWMAVHEYPGLTLHSEEHEIFSNKVVKFKKDFDNSTISVSLELLQFLMSWLTNHILMIDGEYGLFAKGLQHDSIEP